MAEYLSHVNIVLFSLIPAYCGLRYAMRAKQMSCVLRAGQLQKERDLMAEYALVMLVGAIIGMVAQTIMAGKTDNPAWHHPYQQRER